MRRLATALLPLLLLVPALTTGRWLAGTAKAARSLASEPEAARRRAVLGAWTDPVERIRERVPPDGSVDFVMLSPEAQEVAVFAGAALAPRDCRFFRGWDDWRARKRAAFFHDARAANAPPGPPPSAADLVVEADSHREPALRIVE